jgi:3-hydroxyisobutyrate dehydrogenase-like beta-hydroxyacid dehydrogenase
MTMCVGVVGLGSMGGPIAGHLLAAGVATTVLDVDSEAAERLGRRGAVVASSAADLSHCDVVLVVVPSDDDVLAVCESGLLEAMQPGSVLVLSSSVRPETCTRVAERAGKVQVLDAALTGGVRGAEAGRVNLLVGGDEHVLDRIRPVLEPWTVAVHHLGGLGAGQVGKTVNNLCHWAQVAVVQEALLLGHRLGVEPAKARAALLDGPGRSGTLAEIEQMRLTWWKKDIDNARAMASVVGHPLPLTEKVYELMPGITVERIGKIMAGRDPDRE